MAPLRSLVTATLLLLSAANAHFVLNSPTSLEGETINEDKEGNAPCGADLPDLSKNTTNDFHVDGDFVSVQLGHPQGNWLIRATLDGKASGNWSQLFPIVTQSGLGNFCEPIVTAPKEWVGKTGVIGVAVKAPDGILYQCAVVNFVAGTNTPGGDSCKNGSSVTGSFSSDPALAALVGNPASTTSAIPSSSPSPSSPA
ncbi:hypothetical protein B0T25DRAFT_427604, partial [Lasiosphaeria hispida]